jgi:DNA-binding beta-propeller fold protein YncE
MRSLRTALVLGLMAAFGTPARAQPAPEVPKLKVLKSVPLGGDGEWGFPTIDVEARRLYLPRTKIVQVMDLDKGTLVGAIPGVSEQVCHGVALTPDLKLGFASAGKDNNVAVFDPATLKVTARIESSVNPNFTLYDPASKSVVVMNHLSVTIIDPTDLKVKPVVLEIGKGLEYGVADGKGSVFVCVENEDVVVRIDTKARKVAGRWSVAPGKVPVGIAMDSKNNRLLVTCRSKAGADEKKGLLVVMDAATEKVLTTAPIGFGASGIWFDPLLGVAFTANSKEGTVSVVKETRPGTYEAVQTLKTVVGARHIAFDAKTRQCYLPCQVPGAGGDTLGVLLLTAADDQTKKVEVIKLEDAPRAVRDAIEGRFPGAKVSVVERETENGKVIYEVQLTHKDCKYEVFIKEDGTIEAFEKESELRNVPEKVLKAIKDKYPNATIQGGMEVYKVVGKEETLDHYLIAVKLGDMKKEISVSLDGKIK